MMRAMRYRQMAIIAISMACSGDLLKDIVTPEVDRFAREFVGVLIARNVEGVRARVMPMTSADPSFDSLLVRMQQQLPTEDKVTIDLVDAEAIRQEGEPMIRHLVYSVRDQPTLIIIELWITGDQNSLAVETFLVRGSAHSRARPTSHAVLR